MKKTVLNVLLIFLLGNSLIAQDLPRAGSFGAAVDNIDDSLKLALKLNSNAGTHLIKIIDGSSAKEAGFLENDVLVTLDGLNIENTAHFLALLKKYKGGDKLTITFYRNAKLKSISMTLKPKEKEKSDYYDIIYTSVRSGDNQLRTIITKPKGSGVYPAVLVVGGVGCYSIDNNNSMAMKMWVDSLTLSGFVTLRVEKPGMGDSGGIACKDCDFLTEKAGYLEGLKQMKSLSYVDKENLFIVGFSMGGVFGPLLAQEVPVKGIIAYGTAGRNWFEYELENTHRQRLLEDYPADSIDIWMRNEYIRLYGLYVEKKLPEEIIQEHPETAPNFFKYPMGIKYFQQVADIDIRKMWMQTNAYVLAMHGASDYVSSAKEHELIAETVNRYHPQKATYLEIPNADHWEIFTESEKISMAKSQSKITPLALQAALKWLRALS